jgi:hypothetical protein
MPETESLLPQTPSDETSVSVTPNASESAILTGSGIPSFSAVPEQSFDLLAQSLAFAESRRFDLSFGPLLSIPVEPSAQTESQFVGTTATLDSTNGFLQTSSLRFSLDSPPATDLNPASSLLQTLPYLLATGPLESIIFPPQSLAFAESVGNDASIRTALSNGIDATVPLKSAVLTASAASELTIAFVRSEAPGASPPLRQFTLPFVPSDSAISFNIALRTDLTDSAPCSPSIHPAQSPALASSATLTPSLANVHATPFRESRVLSLSLPFRPSAGQTFPGSRPILPSRRPPLSPSSDTATDLPPVGSFTAPTPSQTGANSAGDSAVAIFAGVGAAVLLAIVALSVGLLLYRRRADEVTETSSEVEVAVEADLPDSAVEEHRFALREWTDFLTPLSGDAGGDPFDYGVQTAEAAFAADPESWKGGAPE